MLKWSKRLWTRAGSESMCTDEFKKKVEELVAELEAGVEDKALYEMVKQIVLSDSELAEFITGEEKTMDNIKLKLEPQAVNYQMMQALPQRWELVRDNGRMLYSDEELEKALILLIFNLGVEKTLDMIQPEID